MSVNDNPTAWIQAFKRNSDHLVACDLKDEEACLFSVKWRGRDYPEQDIPVRTQLEAERLVHAFHDVFKAGQRDAFLQLRQLIGAAGVK